MAIDFDGVSQYVNIPGSSSLDCSSAMTITFWCYGKSDAQNHILNKDDGSTNRVWIIRPESSTSLNCHIWTSTGTLIYGGVANSFALNAWHFYTMRAYVSGENVYVETWMDGVYKGENHAAGTALKTATAQAIQFCRNIYGDEYKYYSGILSDVRVYNRSLSANEIAEIYHKRGADRVWQGLAGWWKMDELPSGSSSPVTLDSMDSTTGWSSGNPIASCSTCVEGTASVSLGKSTTNSTDFYMTKTISTVNLTNKYLYAWYYIKDSTTLSKIAKVSLSFGQNISNFYIKYKSDLSVGWNLLYDHVDNFTVGAGSPNKTSVTFLLVMAWTYSASQTLATGNFATDYIRYTSQLYEDSVYIRDHSGSGNNGTPYNSPTYQDSPHRLRRGVLIG